MRSGPLLALLCLTSACAARSANEPNLLSVRDILAFEKTPADARIAYGQDPLQFGELRLPNGEGPHPVALLIHGGCWLAEFDVVHVQRLAAALTAEGIATWTIEYRRVGNPGGGWPGTFTDVAEAADHLSQIAEAHALDLNRAIAIGHSAGGQLALWLAARLRFPEDSAFRAKDPFRMKGVLGLAPAADLAYLHGTGVCGDVVDRLMGGGPSEVPRRYAQASGTELVVLDVPQILVLGAHDDTWSPPAARYAEVAVAAGAPVRIIDAKESGHFEMIDPRSTTWPLVRDATRALLEMD